ncbi:MAG TPA: prepilin-type N-terminal cleavage/methylation domain-containing protein [Gammaproteobacteria bacterium]|nr:prepilin-type N-terminal cleavage/methylation domain-containing protein [Gammaproteobacteria bacterium]
MKKQTGFTLIELVTVIIILGILAAFAVPRFIDLSTQARAASIQGIGGSVQAASALAHSVAVANGTSTISGPAAIKMDGVDIEMTYGFPSATTNGIVTALQSVSGFNSPSASGTTTFTLQNGPSASANCQVTYTQAGSAGDSPDIAIDASACG